MESLERWWGCLPKKPGEPLLPIPRMSGRFTPPTSPDGPERIQAMIEQGAFVLNRGLGAMNVRIRPSGNSGWCSRASLLMILGSLVTIPSVFSIETHYQLICDESLFTSDLHLRSAGLTRLAAIPLTCGAVNFLVQHIRQTTFWWERDDESRTLCCFDPLALWPMLLVAMGLIRSACLKLINDTAAGSIAYYIEAIIALILLSLYFALLDLIDGLLRGMVQDQEVINTTKPVSKMQDLVRSITRSGRPEKDMVYCFGQTNTVPAEVLSYVWWLYYIVGKMLGVAITLSIFMGLQSSIISHMVAGSLALSAMTASGFMFELGPNTLSLFRLSLNKPFYVGDLITLNSTGAMDAPATSIMGFVENITMMYVVIRNFEMKQTWIPHTSFSSLIIQNWTRRPSKTVLLNIGVSSRCSVKKVEQLTAFGMKWIQSSVEIQQANYRKCHITKTGNGYNIEIIFFPAIGVSHRGIRQKFLVAFMAMAERLQVPFVPLQITQNFCDGSQGVTPDAPGFVSDEAMFADLLPKPDDRLPKGVGLGFREFPKNEMVVPGDPGEISPIQLPPAAL